MYERGSLFLLQMTELHAHFIIAEKSGGGNEENRCKGADYDNYIFDSFVYYFICSGVSYLKNCKSNRWKACDACKRAKACNEESKSVI